ncbi:MAG: hypothetical protein AAB521_00890 [Patescibacteria group bacterium]
MKLKEKLPLAVGIFLPLLLILYVVITTYLPTLFVKPEYNFIYVGDNYNDSKIDIVSGKISIQPRYRNYRYGEYIPQQPTFYLYDSASDKNTLISIEETYKYNIDPSSKSPDGFTVGSRDSNYSYFPFFLGTSDRGVYFTGKGLSRKITGQEYNFKFVGWVAQ